MKLIDTFPQLCNGHTPQETYLVGGAVRDLIFGQIPKDIDLAYEGPAHVVALNLHVVVTDEYPEFGIIKGMWRGYGIDIAECREEKFVKPGKHPLTRPAADIRTDLKRRDFTINAMARPLWEPDTLIDPFDGLADLGDMALRVLHDSSFIDDPTRVLRMANYAARLGMWPEPHTEMLAKAVSFAAVSAPRLDRAMKRNNIVGTARQLLESWGVELPY